MFELRAQDVRQVVTVGEWSSGLTLGRGGARDLNATNYTDSVERENDISPRKRARDQFLLFFDIFFVVDGKNPPAPVKSFTTYAP